MAPGVKFDGQYRQAVGSTTPSLTLGSLTAGNNSNFAFGLNGSGADYVAITNAATVGTGATLTLNVTPGSSLTSGTYNLFTDTAGGLGNFTLTNTSVTTGGFTYNLSLNAMGVADILTIGAGQIAKL